MSLPRLFSPHFFPKCTPLLALLGSAPCVAAVHAATSVPSGSHRWQLAACFALIVLEAVLIAILWRALRARQQGQSHLEESLAQRTHELQAANHALELQGTTDALTGIGNRRHMDALVGAELERTRRSAHPLSLLMIDIDGFKHVNDHAGHDAGDRALVAVAMALSVDLRASDALARFGGEEFVVLMPDTELDVACEAADRLRASVAKLRLEGEGGVPVTLTISIGVAAARLPRTFDTPLTLFARAEGALRVAKAEGSNRVARAGESA